MVSADAAVLTFILGESMDVVFVGFVLLEPILLLLQFFITFCRIFVDGKWVLCCMN